MTDNGKRFIIDLAIGLALAGLVAWLRGLFTAVTGAEITSALCDGFFVSAVLTGGLGILKYVKSQGFFDAAFFGLRKVFQLKWQSLGDWREDYYDYRQKKTQSRSSARPQLLAGAVYLALSLIALVIYWTFL